MKKVTSIIILSILVLSSAGCGIKEVEVVNIYTDRHYDTDQALYDKFTEEIGIVVNVVKAGSNELLERLSAEGKDTEADLLITSDVGRLYRAGEMDLVKEFLSSEIKGNVPKHLRSKNDLWTALTVLARVITYAIDSVDPSTLSTYEALTEAEWADRALVRSSGNIYNQSLLASFIALNGEEAAKEWAAGLVANMARTPEGNDRDQMKAVVEGEGDVAIIIALIVMPSVFILLRLFHPPTESWLHIKEYVLAAYIRNSLFLVVGVSVITGLLGVFFAWSMARYKWRFGMIIEGILFLPMTIHPILRGICMVVFSHLLVH